jgi:uncharacterized protein YkwD
LGFRRVKTASRIFGLLGLLMLFACAKGGETYSGSADAHTIFKLINEQRAAQGLSALTSNATLDESAQFQAETMADLDQLDHTLSGSAYPGLTDRLKHFGYNYSAAAENIAYNYSGPEKAVDQWVNSSGHWANITDSRFTETGIAVVTQKSGKIFFCQVFGTR